MSQAETYYNHALRSVADPSLFSCTGLLVVNQVDCYDYHYFHCSAEYRLTTHQTIVRKQSEPNTSSNRITSIFSQSNFPVDHRELCNVVETVLNLLIYRFSTNTTEKTDVTILIIACALLTVYHLVKIYLDGIIAQHHITYVCGT